MKRICIVLLGLTLLASPTLLITQNSSSGTVKTGPAHVVVYRAKRMSYDSIKPSVYLETREVALIYPSTYFTVTVQPGQHVVASSATCEAGKVALDAVSGETYYLRVAPVIYVQATRTKESHCITGGVTAIRFAVEQVSRDTAMEELQKLHPLEPKRVSMPDIVSVEAIAK